MYETATVVSVACSDLVKYGFRSFVLKADRVIARSVVVLIKPIYIYAYIAEYVDRRQTLSQLQRGLNSHMHASVPNRLRDAASAVEQPFV